MNDLCLCSVAGVAAVLLSSSASFSLQCFHVFFSPALINLLYTNLLQQQANRANRVNIGLLFHTDTTPVLHTSFRSHQKAKKISECSFLHVCSNKQHQHILHVGSVVSHLSILNLINHQTSIFVFIVWVSAVNPAVVFRDSLKWSQGFCLSASTIYRCETGNQIRTRRPLLRPPRSTHTTRRRRLRRV